MDTNASSGENLSGLVIDADCAMNFLSTDPVLVSNFYRDSSRRLITIVIPIVVIFGILGNMSFLFVLGRLQDMRNMTNFYLANLALADIGVLGAASIQYFLSYGHSAPLDITLIGYTFETPFGCLMPNLLNYTCYFASVWFITLVASERYLAICHPLKQLVISSKRRALRLVVSVWLVSLFMASFSASYAAIAIICVHGPSGGPFDDLPRKISQCNQLPNTTWCKYVLWIIDTMQFFVALISNTIMYIKIIYTLSKVVKDNQHLCKEERTRVRNTENRDAVAKMLLINAVIFFFCLSPFMIVNIHNISGERLLSRDLTVLMWIARLAYLLNSAVDPYIFSGVNRKYRQAFKRAFQIEYCCHSNYDSFGAQHTRVLSVTTTCDATNDRDN